MFQTIKVHAPQKAYNAEGLNVGDVVVGVVPNSISPCGQVDGFNRFFVPLEYGYLLSRYIDGMTFLPLGYKSYNHPHIDGFENVSTLLVRNSYGMYVGGIGAGSVGFSERRGFFGQVVPSYTLSLLKSLFTRNTTEWTFTGDGYEVFEKDGIYFTKPDSSHYKRLVLLSRLFTFIGCLYFRFVSAVLSPFALVSKVLKYSGLRSLVPVLMLLGLHYFGYDGIEFVMGLDVSLSVNYSVLDILVVSSLCLFSSLALIKGVVLNRDFYASLLSYWEFYVLGYPTPNGESLETIIRGVVVQRKRAYDLSDPLSFVSKGFNSLGSNGKTSSTKSDSLFTSDDVGFEVASDDVAFKISTVLEDGTLSTFKLEVPVGCSIDHLEGVLTTRVLGDWEGVFRDALTWLNRHFSQLNTTSHSFVEWLELNTGLDEVYIMKRLALIETQMGIDGVFSRHMRIETDEN